MVPMQNTGGGWNVVAHQRVSCRYAKRGCRMVLPVRFSPLLVQHNVFATPLSVAAHVACSERIKLQRQMRMALDTEQVIHFKLPWAAAGRVVDAGVFDVAASDTDVTQRVSPATVILVPVR